MVQSPPAAITETPPPPRWKRSSNALAAAGWHTIVGGADASLGGGEPHHRNSSAAELRAELLKEYLEEARVLGAAGKPRPTTAAIEAAVDSQVATMFPPNDALVGNQGGGGGGGGGSEEALPSFCGSCGTARKGGAVFCVACGTRLGE